MRIETFSKLVMIEYTLFGLPWVVTSALLPFASPLLAASTIQLLNQRGWTLWICMIVAFTSARTAGMALNRWIDCDIDALNPRTTDRPLPSGQVTRNQVAILAIASLGIFITACGLINSLCLALSPIVVLLLCLYSFAKRYTMLCHFVLGLVHFFVPIFAWAAMTGTINLPPILLGVIAFASISGNDIIYACQDMEYDKNANLYSIPAKLGIRTSLIISRLLHLACVILMGYLGVLLNFNLFYFLGVSLIATIYLYFHNLVKFSDLNQLNTAFFYSNTLVALTLMVFTVGEIVWHALS